MTGGPSSHDDFDASRPRPGHDNIFFTIIHDLSDRAYLDRLVRETELFRDLTSAIEEVFWLFDWHTQEPIYVSAAYGRIWGRAVETLEQDPRDWTPFERFVRAASGVSAAI
jgi:hypothetical protein